MKNKYEWIISIPKVIWGLFLASVGTVMMIHAQIGLFPWGTLHAGLAKTTGISFGVWSQIIGVGILIMMSFLKYYPGVGTLLDVFFVGYFIDLIEKTPLIPEPNSLILQILLSLTGLVVLSYGMSVYMRCGLGAGPRDGLMLMLLQITGKSVTFIKTSIEMIVTVLGLILGGPFGFGTILLALIGGRVLQWVFKWTQYNEAEVKQRNVIDLLREHNSIQSCDL